LVNWADVNFSPKLFRRVFDGPFHRSKAYMLCSLTGREITCC
jgi:hypothetical protein